MHIASIIEIKERKPLTFFSFLPEVRFPEHLGEAEDMFQHHYGRHQSRFGIVFPDEPEPLVLPDLHAVLVYLIEHVPAT